MWNGKTSALPIHTRVINACQRVFAVLINMKQHLKRGNLAGNSNLIRDIDLAIVDFEEFEIMFSARGAPAQHTGARETIAMWQVTRPFPPPRSLWKRAALFPPSFLMSIAHAEILAMAK